MVLKSAYFLQDEGDNKVLKLRFDVSQYAPEEIVVKTVDQKLLVSLYKSCGYDPYYFDLHCP